MFHLCLFLAFLATATTIFFLPNHPLILLLIPFNILLAFFAVHFAHADVRRILRGTLNFLPFIFLTLIFNFWLDTPLNALFIGLKLLLVCNLTMIYASTTTTLSLATTVERLFTPLKLFGVDTADLKILVCIALSLVPVIKRDLHETRAACTAKGINLSLSNARLIVSHFLIRTMSRISDLEASLLAKGYSGE